jgi:peptidyl-tRNA hydrolase, PTH1 family
LKSMIANLGETFMRLRIGIGGSSDAAALSDHVLGEFERAERPTIERAVERAAEAIEHVADHGIASAMNNYNQAE